VKKLLKILAPVTVLLVSFGIVQVLNAAKPEPEKKENAHRVVSLHVDEVRQDQVTISVQTQGEVKPKTEIELIPQVSGRIVAISESFAEGSEFEPGTLLVKIDDTDYRLAVIRAEARVAAAKVRVEQELANAKIKQSHWLDKSGASQPSPFALNELQVDEAKANLRAAEADLKEAQLNVDRTLISVPFRGHVRARHIGIGQYVSAGTPLGTVFSTDSVEIRLPLTDSQLAELDLPMGFTADAFNAPLVRFSARVGNHERSWDGRIVRTSASVDQQTRLIYAIAEVEDPYGLGADTGAPLAVGMFVMAEIAGVKSQAALVLPRMALRNANKVYVINDDNRLEIRTVEVLSTSEESVLVTEGVEPGEMVVTSTIPAAVEGMEVRAINTEAAS
jgi:RND family efflux transporter MFP subunit